MRLFYLLGILFSFSITLHAVELPADSSKSLVKAEERYRDDVKEVAEDLISDLKKQLQRHIKAYAKVEKVVKKDGDVRGLKIISKRLKALKGVKSVGLFDSKETVKPKDEPPILISDLPSEAQKLEQEYESDVSEIIQEHFEDLNKSVASWKKSLLQERRKLVNKDALDQAEQIQEIIDQTLSANHNDRMSKAIKTARLLNDVDIEQLQVSQLWLAGSTIQNYVVFNWYNSKMQNMVFDINGRPLARCDLTVRDQAAFDEAGHMNTEKGAFVSSVNGVAIVKACRKTNQLSVEANIQTHSFDQHGPARIISFSLDGNERNFTIGQSGGALILRLRTNLTDTNGTSPEIELGGFPASGRAHVIVSYYPGQLVWWINGERHASNEISGDFSTWNSSHALLFGDELHESRHWSGRLWGVRIRSAAVDDEMAKRAFAHAEKTWASAVSVPLEHHDDEDWRDEEDEAIKD